MDYYFKKDIKDLVDKIYNSKEEEYIYFTSDKNIAIVRCGIYYRLFLGNGKSRIRSRPRPLICCKFSNNEFITKYYLYKFMCILLYIFRLRSKYEYIFIGTKKDICIVLGKRIFKIIMFHECMNIIIIDKDIFRKYNVMHYFKNS